MGSTGRPTAAIDHASLSNDIIGVEQAIRAYARADEVVVRVRVVNSFTHPVTLCLEPYAEEVVLAPGRGAVVLACGPKPQSATAATNSLEIEFSDAPPRITVWLWGEAIGNDIPEFNQQILTGG